MEYRLWFFWPIRMFTFRHGRVCDLRQRVCVWQVCQHIRHVQMHLRQGIPIWQRGRPWVFMKLSVACSFNLAHRYCFHNLCVWQKWIVNVISQFLVYASKYLLRGQLLLRYDPPYSFKNSNYRFVITFFFLLFFFVYSSMFRHVYIKTITPPSLRVRTSLFHLIIFWQKCFASSLSLHTYYI